MPTPTCLICSAWWFKKKKISSGTHTSLQFTRSPSLPTAQHPEHHHLCLFPGPYRHLSVHPNNQLILHSIVQVSKFKALKKKKKSFEIAQIWFGCHTSCIAFGKLLLRSSVSTSVKWRSKYVPARSLYGLKIIMCKAPRKEEGGVHQVDVISS